MIFDINKQGFYDPSTKIKTEGIAFGISLEEDYESDIIKFTNELREKGLIGKNPIVITKPYILLEKFPAVSFFIMRKDVHKHFFRKFNKLLSLREAYYKKMILHQMIYYCPDGTELTFGENGSTEIIYPEGFEPETVLKKWGIDQRTVDSYTPVSDWNSSFLDVSFITMRDTLNEKGKDNIKNLVEEREESYKAYNSMKGFPENFEKI